MPSELQHRAEKALVRLKEHPRKPVVIEFAGVPKAGKTSTINEIKMFLKRCGFRVEVVIERASVCPIKDKKHADFNVWTACTTLANIVDKTQNPPNTECFEQPHVLILDRGLFDSICWFTMMVHLKRILPVEQQLLEKFLTMNTWRRRINAVILMVASPEDAMRRETVICLLR